MNDTNHEYQGRDALDDIDDTVGQITDEHIEDRLQETLRHAGCASGQPAGSEGTEAQANPSWLLMWA